MPDRPDQRLAAAWCKKELAAVWNLPLEVLASLGPDDLAGDDEVALWLRALCALVRVEAAVPARFPRAVAVPLRDLRGETSGALGLVECHHSTRMAKAPPDAAEAAARVLGWLGTERQLRLAARFHLPDGTEGGSVALAVLIAGLLASEPDLLPEFGGPDPDAHRFAATGSSEIDGSGRLRLVRPEGMAAKMQSLRERGYGTLFTIAAAPGTARIPSPAGLEVVELPAGLEDCCRELRRWFLARRSLASRLPRALRRPTRAAQAGLAAVCGTVALGLGALAIGAARPAGDALATERGRVPTDAAVVAYGKPPAAEGTRAAVNAVYTFDGQARRDIADHHVTVRHGFLDRDTGEVRFLAEVGSDEPITGFRGAARVEFLDAVGRPLHALESARLGVNGRFLALCRRSDAVESKMPVEAARAVVGHRVLLLHFPHAPWALLVENVRQLAQAIRGR
jgi:hypothetical protein